MNPNEARQLAIRLHGQQRYGDAPYVAHLDAVVAVLREFNKTDDTLLCVAYLHDTIEDTAATEVSLVADGVPKIVAQAVHLCSQPEGRNRAERVSVSNAIWKTELSVLYDGACGFREDYSAALRLALPVKLADRIANMRNCVATGNSMLRRYRKEAAAFRGALGHPKSMDDLNIRSMWDVFDYLTNPVA